MRRLALTVEYDGSAFSGWQLQTNGRSVQGSLEQAIENVTGRTARVIGAGRTDAGVHARGQVAHLELETPLSTVELRKALNAVLPEDVAVLRVEDVASDFDARHATISKRYVYRILSRASPSPQRRSVCWHLRARLDVKAMREAAETLKGTHDFAAFRGAPGGPPTAEDTRRTLDRLEIVSRMDELHVVVEGRSFLRYMVRNLVGTLVEVGQRRRDPASMATLLKDRDRSRAGPTAPAHGLCLERIVYPDRSQPA